MKTYTWSLPTRLFHWLLAIGIIAAYFLGEEEELINLHSSIGYGIGILVIFRIIWGFAGPSYSRFSDFPIGIGTIRSYTKNIFRHKHDSPGHNPLASVVMLGIILVTALIVCSGIALLSSRGDGFFPGFSIGLGSEALKELHEIFVNLLIALVILHLAGNAVDFLTNRKAGTLQSMFTGYKNLEGKNARLNAFQVILASLFLVAALAVIPYSVANQKISAATEETGDTGDGEVEDED
jgi:cytochrome b